MLQKDIVKSTGTQDWDESGEVDPGNRGWTPWGCGIPGGLSNRLKGSRSQYREHWGKGEKEEPSEKSEPNSKVVP